jgi:hypothetical protein
VRIEGARPRRGTTLPREGAARTGAEGPCAGVGTAVPPGPGGRAQGAGGATSLGGGGAPGSRAGEAEGPRQVAA